MMGGTRFHDTCQTNASLLTSCPTFRLSSLTFFFAVGLAWSSQCPRGGNCGAGVSPAVARASCPRHTYTRFENVASITGLRTVLG